MLECCNEAKNYSVTLAVVCVYTLDIQMRELGQEEGQQKINSNNLAKGIFCNHSLHCFLLPRAPESPLMTGWLSKCQCKEISQEQNMITVRELDSEGDQDEVCARKIICHIERLAKLKACMVRLYNVLA